MKLAIICEMPETRVEKPDVSLDAYTPEEHSARAEKSAKDAFAYCQGPFTEMAFVREALGCVTQARQDGVDWILTMSHDCLVDIQAFEEVGVAFKSLWVADMVNFHRWSNGGPSGPTSQSRFWFQKNPFSRPIAPTLASRRILIEPEANAIPSL